MSNGNGSFDVQEAVLNLSSNTRGGCATAHRQCVRPRTAQARARVCVATALVWAVLLSALCVHSQPEGNEYQVKAAFLFNFGKFVEWPDSSFVGDGAPFSICVVGNDPFGGALDALRGKFIGHRPVAVWRIKNADDGWRCQVVFVSASEKSHFDAIFRTLRGSNALLVSDTPGFAAAGGAIELTVEDNHVHFIINPDAIQRARLRVSSQLLALAKIVRDAPSGGRS
jgi:hypothetical protein